LRIRIAKHAGGARCRVLTWRHTRRKQRAKHYLKPINYNHVLVIRSLIPAENGTRTLRGFQPFRSRSSADGRVEPQKAVTEFFQEAFVVLPLKTAAILRAPRTLMMMNVVFLGLHQRIFLCALILLILIISMP